MSSPKKILKEVFGYDEFRPLQAEIIANILARKDTLVIMPTGGGKSLCYQIPALIFDGLTIVVSPLISLMKDQVEQLRAVGVQAVFLNSTLSPEEYSHHTALVRDGKVRMLYVAPETLLMPRTLELLASVQVDCLTIDEAHCISEWGHDFRPEYRQLLEVRNRFPKAVTTALTATATPRVQDDIRDSLQFDDSGKFIASFDRKNLFLRVKPKTDATGQTIRFLREYPEKSGIIYCLSRRQVDELSDSLDTMGFSVKPYHAGLPAGERQRNQELFIRDDVQIIVATIAFGMGINKPNVRFVIHYDLPKNIEGYYQEIGRAGRDGLRAECLLLFSYGDKAKIQYFIEQKEQPERRIAYAHLDAMVEYAESYRCRRKPLLDYFGESYETQNCGMCDSCLAGEPELIDITVAAQMFLSCVKRTREMFGANHIIDILRGSESQKIMKFDHHQLPTYGIGGEYSKKQWMHLSRQFIQQKLVEKDGQYGGMRLTSKAADVLWHGSKVNGKVEEEAAKFDFAEETARYDVELFQHLKKRRKQLADRDNVPPYVIFPDRALIEMATFFPQSEQSMLAIHGVGQAKFSKYGNRFLSDIRGYCRRKGVEEVPRGTAKTRRSRSSNRRQNEVGEAFSKGSPLAVLESFYEVKRGTILNHILNYIRDGHTVPADRSDLLVAESGLNVGERQLVFDEFEKLGMEVLKPVFEALNDKVDYDELRLLRLAFIIKNGLQLKDT